MKVLTDTGVVELTAEEYAQQFGTPPEIAENEQDAANMAQKLAEGLSTATTIAQIRAVAKAILDETETGGESNGE